MRAPSITALALLTTLACAGRDEPPDELDGAVIDELSTAQGSASGAAWSGSYSAEFTSTSCDCPTYELDGMPLDVCSLVEQSATQLELTQTDGFLLVAIGEAMLTGAIEADDAFVVAGRQDLSTLVGPLELLGRIDGSLEQVDGSARMSGDVGQRVIGEFAGDAIDCRWLGTVEATRID